MLGMSRIAVFFQWFVVPDVRKVASLKRRVRRSLFSRQMKNGTPLLARSTLASQNVKNTWCRARFLKFSCSKMARRCWHEAHWQVKMSKIPGVGHDFWSSHVQKWHAAAARSTLASQNVKNTWCRARFLKFSCSKMARRCWREAHWQVKMSKIPGGGQDFWSSHVQKWHAAVARSTFSTQKVKNTGWRARFLKFSCSKMASRCGAKHIGKSKCQKYLVAGRIFEVLMCKNGTPLLARSTLASQNAKNTRWRDFWSSHVQKWHAAAARSTLASQNVNWWRARFLKLWCSKMARRCGTKHIGKSKCQKYLVSGTIFEVLMFKNGTPLRREAHWQVKMSTGGGHDFWSSHVQKWHAAVARSTLASTIEAPMSKDCTTVSLDN